MSAYQNRYARQEILPEIGVEGQAALKRAGALIVGCGALGCFQSQLLTRAGIGFIRVVDRDLVETSNLARQILFDEGDAEAQVAKADAAGRRLRAVNSSISIETLAADATPRNVEKLLDGVHIVLDGTDNFETRYLINDACVKTGKPWVYGGVIGTTGMTMLVRPGAGPCLRCIIPDVPPPGSFPTCDTAGVLSSAVAVVASLQVAAALRCLVGDSPSRTFLTSLDVWNASFHAFEVKQDEACPCCVGRNFEFLGADCVSWTTILCGRDSVQVTPPRDTRIDFLSLGKRLLSVGEVVRKGVFLQFRNSEGEMVIFPDGRAIVAGTTDEARARSFYSRYVGV